jgi:hypothetical protein
VLAYCHVRIPGIVLTGGFMGGGGGEEISMLQSLNR